MRRLAAAAALATLTLSAGGAWAAADDASFTPTSLRVPIRRVTLEGASGAATLYACAPSADHDCTVDLADDNALAALFAHAAAVAPGHYDAVGVYACDWEGHYDVRVHGSVVVGRETWYSAGAAVLSTAPADADYTTVTLQGCSIGPQLPVSIDVAADQDVDVSSWFALADSAWVTGSRASWDGCVLTPAGDPLSLCLAPPTLVPYAGVTTPTVERYFISADPSDLTASKAGGEVLLLVDAADHVFGGLLRPLFSTLSVTPRVSFDLPLTRVTASPDGTYVLQSSGDDQAAYVIEFPAFQRQSHDGMSLDEGDASPVPYRAVRQNQ